MIPAKCQYNARRAHQFYFNWITFLAYRNAREQNGACGQHVQSRMQYDSLNDLLRLVTHVCRRRRRHRRHHRLTNRAEKKLFQSFYCNSLCFGYSDCFCSPAQVSKITALSTIFYHNNQNEILM